MEGSEIRLYNPELHTNFIYSTWLKHYKFTSYFAKRIRPSIFFKRHHLVIEHILSKPETKCLVIGPKDDEDSIWGWLAYEPRDEGKHLIHYIYIKETFQKMGLAKKLLAACEINFENIKNIHLSHWTFPVDEAMKRWPEMIYDPYDI